MTGSARFAEAEEWFEDGGRALLRAANAPSFDALAAELPRQPSSALGALVALRDRWERSGELDLAGLATRGVINAHRLTHGDDAGPTLIEVARLGRLLVLDGEVGQGEALVGRAWELTVEALGPGDPDRARVALVLGWLRIRQGRESEAVFPLREAVRDLARVDPDAAAEAGFRLGCALVGFGSVEEGVRLVEGAVRRARAADEPGPELPERLGTLAKLMADRWSPKDVEGLFREAIDAAVRVHGSQSPEAARAHAALGGLLLHVPHRFEEGLGLMDVAVSLLLGSVGPAHPATRSVAAQLVEQLIEVARAAGARKDGDLVRASLGRAASVTQMVFGPGDSRLHRLQELAERLGAR